MLASTLNIYHQTSRRVITKPPETFICTCPSVHPDLLALIFKFVQPLNLFNIMTSKTHAHKKCLLPTVNWYNLRNTIEYSLYTLHCTALSSHNPGGLEESCYWSHLSIVYCPGGRAGKTTAHLQTVVTSNQFYHQTFLPLYCQIYCNKSLAENPSPPQDL